MSRRTKDYTRDWSEANALADKIAEWYHSKGYTGVKVWTEEIKRISPMGTALPSNYSIRSNIKFSVDTL